MRTVGDQVLLCPSSTKGADNDVVFGVVSGTPSDARVTYLRRTLPLVEVRHLAQPVDPGEVFRSGTACAQGDCAHYRESRCGLIDQLVSDVEPVSTPLAFCAIRHQCRWWSQHGAAACGRCARVATADYTSPSEIREAAQPPAPPPLGPYPPVEQDTNGT